MILILYCHMQPGTIKFFVFAYNTIYLCRQSLQKFFNYTGNIQQVRQHCFFTYMYPDLLRKLNLFKNEYTIYTRTTAITYGQIKWGEARCGLLNLFLRCKCYAKSLYSLPPSNLFKLMAPQQQEQSGFLNLQENKLIFGSYLLFDNLTILSFMSSPKLLTVASAFKTNHEFT